MFRQSPIPIINARRGSLWRASRRQGLACAFSLVLLAGCVVAPNYQYVAGGQRIAQPGVSFVLPSRMNWARLLDTTYESAFIVAIKPKDLTLVTASIIYPLPKLSSDAQFLNYIKEKQASNEPDTGRFKQIYSRQSLATYDGATCVVHEAESEDLSPDARRAGGPTIFKTYGMNCRYPGKPRVGVFLELSQKAPPGTSYPEFEPMARAFLNSARFKAF